MKFFFVLFSLIASIASAQIQNPNAVEFTASPDHAVVLNGTPVVDHYELAIVISTVTGALAWSENLLKPTPDANNLIAMNVPRLTTLPRGTYFGYINTVSLIVGMPSTMSAVSLPFSVTGPIAASGRPVFTKK